MAPAVATSVPARWRMSGGPDQRMEPRLDRVRKCDHIVPGEQWTLRHSFLGRAADARPVRQQKSVVDRRREDRLTDAADAMDRINPL
jgi:hypothetical protein